MVTDKTFELLAELSDGAPHSGEALAARRGITRAAVWERIKRLQALGVELKAVSGQGYQLAAPFEPLNAATITSLLPQAARALLPEVVVSTVTDSTNQRLLEAAATRSIHGMAWLAELQTAGRGRRGDRWLAAPGAAVCLSLGWRFEQTPRDLGALSLAVGVAVVRGLQGLGARGLGLKWPNDILLQGGKLAGILIEMRSELGGPSTVVIGVGLNLTVSSALRAEVGQPVAALAEVPSVTAGRNAVAAALLAALAELLTTYAATGFAPLREAWCALDALAGREVEITLGDRAVRGIARGVDGDGLLQIEHDGRMERFLAGHVRPVEAA